MRKITILLLYSLVYISCTPNSEQKEEESKLPNDPFQPEIPAIVTPVDIQIDLPIETDINAWLISNPVAAGQLIWYEEDSGWIPWIDWTPGLKDLLQDAFQSALNGTSIAPITPLDNLASREQWEAPLTILSFEDARNLFFSQVAWSILVDAQQMVPWSLSSLNEEELGLIFDGRQYFDEKEGCTYPNGSWDPGQKVCAFRGLKIREKTIIAAPGHWTYGLLVANDLIGETRKATISKVCEWTSNNFAHMSGPNNEENMLKLYGYNGIPSLVSIVEAEPFIDGKSDKPMYACWGATQFLKTILAQANIPVEYFVVSVGHRLPRFVSEGLALSHGDDLYNGNFRNDSSFPMPIPYDEVFITEQKFQTWFGPQTTAEEKDKNVARRMDELAIKYLTFPIIKDFCLDQEEGNRIAESHVYNRLKDHYTMQDLQQIQLWQKLAGKVQTLEYGCGELNQYYQ